MKLIVLVSRANYQPNLAHDDPHYQQMRENCRPFACELAEDDFHPARLLRLCDLNGMNYLADYMELIGD